MIHFFYLSIYIISLRLPSWTVLLIVVLQKREAFRLFKYPKSIFGGLFFKGTHLLVLIWKVRYWKQTRKFQVMRLCFFCSPAQPVLTASLTPAEISLKMGLRSKCDLKRVLHTKNSVKIWNNMLKHCSILYYWVCHCTTCFWLGQSGC